MGNCKDCKFWKGGGEDDYYTIVEAGLCKRAKQFWDSTEWEQQPNDGKGTLEVKRVRKDTNDLHFVQDGSDFSADLITLPEFGCVQFEDK